MLTLELVTRSSHEFRGCISTYPQTPHVSSCFGSQTEEFPRNVNETIEWNPLTGFQLIRKTLDHRDTGRQDVFTVNKMSSLRVPENSQEEIPAQASVHPPLNPGLLLF